MIIFSMSKLQFDCVVDIDSDEEYNELYNNATSAWEQMEIIERLRRGVAAAQLNIDNAWVDIEDDNEEEEEVETVMLDRPPAYRRYDIFGPSPRGGQTRRRSPR